MTRRSCLRRRPRATAGRGSFGIAALEMRLAGGNFLTGVEAIAAAHGAQAMIHGLRAGLGTLFELMTNIVDERGLGDFGQRSILRCEPTSEIEEVVGVDAQRPRGKLAQALGVEKGIRPHDFSSLLVAHPIGGSAGSHARLMDHGEFHVLLQPHRSSNCLTLSRSEAASRRAVWRTHGTELEVWSGSGGEESRPFRGEPAGRSSTW